MREVENIPKYMIARPVHVRFVPVSKLDRAQFFEQNLLTHDSKCLVVPLNQPKDSFYHLLNDAILSRCRHCPDQRVIA